MTITPTIHCLAEREPTSFHLADVEGEALTYSVNVAFEVLSDGLGDVDLEEQQAEAWFEEFFVNLDKIRFYYYHFNPTTGVTPGERNLPTVSYRPPTGYTRFFQWLKSRQGTDSRQRFWTNLESVNGDAAIEAKDAGAFILTRSASSWNAPIGHAVGLTHLGRFPMNQDGEVFILPYFDVPNGPPTHIKPTGTSGEHEFQYNPRLSWWGSGRTTTFDPWISVDPLSPDLNLPGRIVDPDIDPNGYLNLNQEAEGLSRFLDRFESRAAALLSANAGLQIETKDLEPRIRITNSGAAEPVYRIGNASWYVMARLVSALDPMLIALLQPGQDAAVGEAVLAPIAVTILDALDAKRADQKVVPDYEPQDIYQTVRSVFAENCALAGGQLTDERLARSIEHIFGMKPALTNSKVDIGADEPPATIVPLLVAAYHKHPDGIAPSTANAFLTSLKSDSIDALTVALAECEQQLQDEAGAETALIRLFETTEFRADGTSPHPEDRFARRLAAALPRQPVAGSQQQTDLIAAVSTGWDEYLAMLGGPYNGAEAIRRAVAGAACRALLRVAPQPLTVSDLETRLEQANYQARRFAAGSGGECFDVIANALVIPKSRPSGASAPSFAVELEESYKSVAVVPKQKPERFIPDTFPRPLSLQIAAGIDGTSLDPFASAFNGICIAVSRIDPEDSSWAYANLADLRWQPDDPAKTKNVLGALHPVMPAVTDGHATMFLNYEGKPFADRPDLTTLQDGLTYIDAKPFYEAVPHCFPVGVQFERLPRLAYGRKFRSFSFAVSNAGTLPRGLQAAADSPWMPRIDIGALFDGSEPDQHWAQPQSVLEYLCNRRTSIAQMAIEVAGDKKVPGRIGREIVGVHPLSKDYPRLGLMARKYNPGAYDLFRDSDGTGRMFFPDEPTRQSWAIADLRAAGSAATLKILVFNGIPEKPEDTAYQKFDVTDLAVHQNLTLTLEDRLPNAPANAAGFERWLTLSSDAGVIGSSIRLATGTKFDKQWCWLRLVLETEDVHNASSLSFADPASHGSKAQGSPLLLLAPDEGAWNEGLADPVGMIVRSPRVGYADFSRWMANAELGQAAFGSYWSKAKANDFLVMLATANRMRHLSAELGQYLDNLPDPAVERIALELYATDSIDDATHVPVALEYTVPSFKAWLDEPVPAPNGSITPDLLIREYLAPLDRFFSFRLTLGPGNPLALKAVATGFRVEVPSGCAAQLCLSALIPSAHFDGPTPVINVGLLQYSTRRIGNFAAFDAGSRRIETMYDGIGDFKVNDNEIAVNLAAELIAVKQIANTRRYDLVTAAEAGILRKSWRLISEVDVTTQRWRATGRPIYHYISPRKYALPGSDTGQHPSLPLAVTSEAAFTEIDRFERQAFFDRSDADAHTVTQRVQPLGTPTVLQEFPWDSPSATYYRHRFTLRSRYAGALKDEKYRTAPTWTELKQPNKSYSWTMRVAMLADRSRLTLTQPQLRGLIPLTSTPMANETDRPVPPVAAVLQEPPFSRGGLADRVASEIRTGFGYGFDAKTTTPVKIQDSRKEIGPNPHLDYRPFPAEQTLALTLQSEGPLGLTFDPTDSSSPAFANSMVLLKPISLDGNPPPALEEALTAVSMRRYIDPAWLSGAASIDDDTTPKHLLDASRCWWIEPDGHKIDLYYVAGKNVTEVPVAVIEQSGKEIVVSVYKAPIDSGVGQGDQPVKIGRFQPGQSSRPRLLHQQVTPGSFMTTVLVDLDSSQVLDGRANVPVVLCSFEWSVPKPKLGSTSSAPPASVQLGISRTSGRLVAWETMASSATAHRWTQISRDFDVVNKVDLLDDRAKAKALRADRLTARLLKNNAIGFVTTGNNGSVRLCGTTTGNRYPANLHRHIAVISSSFLGELGRSVEKFNRSALALGVEARFPNDPDGDEHALRVIEFETPAAIVCDKNVQAPPAYRRAYFDLLRTGYVQDNALLLTLRFIGDRKHLGDFTKLTVNLIQGNRAKVTTISRNLEKDITPMAMHIYIHRKSVRSWVVYETKTGAVEPAANDLTLDPTTTPGFFLELEANQITGAEFWADISVLHIKPVPEKDGEPIDATAISFDFGLLFSPEAQGDPQTLVSPRGLAEMVEAQARIVSVSPPIPLSMN